MRLPRLLLSSLSCVTLLLAPVIVGAQQTTTRTAAPSPVAPVAPATREDVQALADKVFAQYTSAVPGCVVGVAQTGAILLEKAYGAADLEQRTALTANSILEAGSVAKQFTAAAVTLLALEGKLRFGDEIQKYFPEIPRYERPVTVRMLLDHTSGLRDWGDIVNMAGWRRGTRAVTHAHVLEVIARQRRTNYPPGDRYSYTNSGYNLLAMLVARVSGQTFAEFTRARLFVPLGMTSTSWRDDYRRVVPGRATAYAPLGAASGWATDMPFEDAHGNGALLTTVGDLLRWNEALTKRSVGGVVGSALVDSLTRTGRLTNGESITYAAGLVVDRYRGTTQIGHSGATAGYRAYLARYPEQRDLSVAVLCNNSGASTAHAHAMVTGLAAGLTDVAPSSTDFPVAGTMPHADSLMKFVGDYASDEVGVTFQVRIEDGRLVLRRAPADSWVISRINRDGRFSAGPWQLWFTAQREGPVMHLGSGRAHDVVFSARR
ncbi:MAG: serine hydrolase domain-containing protein [Gemmatimonadaceae bacterium]